MEHVLLTEIPFSSYSADFIPAKAHGSDAAYDLFAASDPILKKSKSGMTCYLEYDTGIVLQLPEKHHALILPRSSIRNMDLMMCNSPGLVDSGYRGNLIVCMRILCEISNALYYKKGERIAQLLIIKEENIILKECGTILSETDRGASGFGSSGV
jgi:dUTP pyrophosphatase